MAFVVQQPGEYNAAGGNAVELNLEKFSGMVLAKLDHRLILMDTLSVRQTVNGAKAIVFPTYGDASASHHVAGEDILGASANYLSEIEVGEHIINVDRKLQSSIFTDDLLNLLNHWDHMSAFAGKLSTAVQEEFETKIFRTIAKGSGGTESGHSEVEGQIISSWDAGQATIDATTTGAELYEAAWAFAEGLDVRNAAVDGRFAAVKTENYYDILRLNTTASGSVAQTVMNRDFTTMGVGPERPPLMGIWIANVFVMPTNGIPQDNTGYTTPDGTEWNFGAAGSDDNSYGDVDMDDDYRFFGWTSDSIGIALGSPMTVDVNYIPERLGHLIVVHQSLGSGVLRPEMLYTQRVTT